jgi:uncharacterized protein (DUF302 family)
METAFNVEDNGVVTVPSPFPVAETMDRLENVLKTKGIKVFVRIDQQREAEEVGMGLRPTELLVFGNPKGGTPIMQASPGAAIDLPLKAVAWQDDNGQTWVSYNAPKYLQKRHRLPDQLVKNIAGVGALIQDALRQ